MKLEELLNKIEAELPFKNGNCIETIWFNPEIKFETRRKAKEIVSKLRAYRLKNCLE